MASILTGHVHPLSMLGCSGIGVYDSVLQFLPISRNFAQPSKRSGLIFHRPRSTTWSTLCKGDVCTAWGKWWSHQILTGFQTPPPDPQYCKTAYFRVAFIVDNLRHTCAIIMLYNQHLDMPHTVRWMDYLSKGEVLTNIDLDRFMNKIWENRPFVFIEKVLDLWFQLMKNGGKNKSVAFIILFSVFYYILLSKKLDLYNFIKISISLKVLQIFDILENTSNSI